MFDKFHEYHCQVTQNNSIHIPNQSFYVFQAFQKTMQEILTKDLVRQQAKAASAPKPEVGDNITEVEN